MHPATEKLLAALRELDLEPAACDYAQRGYHYELDLAADQLRSLAACLLKEEMFLVFVGGLHVKPAIEIIYQFAHYEFPCRLLLRVPVSEANAVPTISDIFQGANWHERETRDFYGVDFVGHPFLKPLILAEEDFDLKPLLKKEADLKESSALRWGAVAEVEAAPAPPKVARKAAPAAGEDSMKAEEK
ncbi:MAG: NADH-quinone oxidoreductase subunit C [Deltaproteobacteria bacterium]|nr:NADH-quinone oxidoreductase subunit C [Deltaproteobacteria bacterium]